LKKESGPFDRKIIFRTLMFLSFGLGVLAIVLLLTIETVFTIGGETYPIGSASLLTPRETAVAFAYGGNAVPLLIRSDHATYYLKSGFSECRLEVTGFDYFWSDYDDLWGAIRTIELDMEASDLIFKDPQKNYDPFSVVLCSEEDAMRVVNSVAYYSHVNHTAYSASVWPISHEYLHFLTTPAVGYDWQYESIAIYYNLSSYFEKMTTQYLIDELMAGNWEEKGPMLAFLGRNAQIGDYATYCDVFIIVHDYEEVNALNPYAMISISDYVYDTYGDETLRQIFLHQDTIQAEIGRTWPGLIEEWKQWLDDTYGYMEE
jgi:hypothetical protein